MHFQRGRFYMHEKAMDVCVRVKFNVPGTYKCRVEWWALGYVGSPWPCPTPKSEIYLNDMWRDITHLVKVPRKDWP